MYRHAALIACAAALAGSAAAAPAPKDDPMTPIRQFLDSFNKSDPKTAYAAFAPGEESIIDEFPPHIWTGARAAQNWAADYDKNAKAEAVTEPNVGYGKPTVVNLEGQAGYVTLPTTYTYKSHGAAMREDANMAFALTHTRTGWKIRAWSWTGTVPHAAK